jgi:peptidoglycan/LPS O-acetylase OafA/YrhL
MTQITARHGLTYRPDIDGLRAFAVLSVLIFHAFPSALPAGFIGVDIFFVISGYLISGIMFRELSEGRFRFSSFYARRIKRIFPALVLILFCTFAVGWWLLFDDEFKQLGNHLLRAPLFLSNFVLLKESGYFDNAAETKPLLHLWSLAIEEQFYLVWPLLVWVLWRLRSHRGLLIGLLWTASMLWNLYDAQHRPERDFYSPLSRFWELLTGAALAYGIHSNAAGRLPKWAGSAPARGTAGMLMLLASVAAIDSSRAFPGAWALLPVLGTALTISAGGSSWWNRSVLSHPLTVWVGSISYPLYLWHWPILSYLRIIEGTTPSATLRAAGVVASIVLAVATYAWVEKPIRFGLSLRFKTAALVAAMSGVGVLGYLVVDAEGYPSRAVMAPKNVIKAGAIDHDSFHQHYLEHLHPCADHEIQKDSGAWKGIVRCFQSKPGPGVDMLLLGDSHAEHLLLGLAERLPGLNIAFYGKGAMPLTSSKEYSLIFNHLLQDNNIRTVIITSYWSGRWNERQSSSPLIQQELIETVKTLQSSGKMVYLASDTPLFAFDPQRCKFKRPLSASTLCSEPADSYQRQRQTYMPTLAAVRKALPETGWIDLGELLCDKQSCSMALGDVVLFRDHDHLNVPGSRQAASLILEQAPELARLKSREQVGAADALRR